MLKLADYPDMLARAAADLAPHDLAFYLRDLSAAFHSYYAAERFLVDDAGAGTRTHGAAGRHAPGAAQRAAAAGRERARIDGARDRSLARGGRMKAQRGGFMVGLVVGLLIGLAPALGVALYVTKVPLPFINKVPQRTAEQDAVEAERNKSWDPNAGLSTRPAPRPARAGRAGRTRRRSQPGGRSAAAACGGGRHAADDDDARARRRGRVGRPGGIEARAPPA